MAATSASGSAADLAKAVAFDSFEERLAMMEEDFNFMCSVCLRARTWLSYVGC